MRRKTVTDEQHKQNVLSARKRLYEAVQSHGLEVRRAYEHVSIVLAEFDYPPEEDRRWYELANVLFRDLTNCVNGGYYPEPEEEEYGQS
jgi:hypothetical protein